MNHWPSLKHYDEEHLDKFAMPLGGIGTGTISLGGRGDFRDCELMNRPAMNDYGICLYFCLQAQGAGLDKPFAKMLEGPIPEAKYEGASGAPALGHGLPRFQHVCADAAYPLTQVRLFEAAAPVEVTLQAFNPLVPADADASGMPVAVLRYVVKNNQDKPLEVSVCGNAVNNQLADNKEVTRKNTFRKGKGCQGVAGLDMTVEGDAAIGQEGAGEVALTTPDHGDITYREFWGSVSWSVPLLKFWDDFYADGRLEPVPYDVESRPVGSLCLRKTIPANGEAAYTFILAWRFPNRRTWTPLKPEERENITPDNDPDIIGNYYCTQFPHAWDAAVAMAAQLNDLEEKTVDFVSAFLQSPVPDCVKEAALFNVSTLRSQTVFRTPDGKMFGWEGCFDKQGSCHGSCTHVWNYEQTTPFLFGELARGMRDTEFMHALQDDGMMNFRVGLPLERAWKWGCAAADGQMGCIMKIYREWKLSGDDDFLKKLWPSVKKALAFCWVKGGWDGDQDGIMEGCQHNTMDVEYFGPNGQMQGWYLGALKSAQIMAEYLKDDDFAQTCARLFDAGSKAMDEKLFNGEFYEQIVMPPHSEENIYKGLRHWSMGTRDLEHPNAQLGKACLVDQLVGPYMAKVIGLPELLDKTHVRKTLESINKYNKVNGVWNHFNNMRSFVCGDENALLMASYPHGGRPDIPFPYFTEVMTGFEYTAAIGMLYEGMEKEGIQVISDIRARYDGRKRSPFNEAECGYHYARAMAAWGAYLALSHFHYDGCSGEMSIIGDDGAWFWSTGNAYGTCAIHNGLVRFSVLGGTVKLNTLHVGERTFSVNEVLSGRTTIRLQ